MASHERNRKPTDLARAKGKQLSNTELKECILMEWERNK